MPIIVSQNAYFSPAQGISSVFSCSHDRRCLFKNYFCIYFLQFEELGKLKQ